MNITSENEARDRVLTLTGRAGHLVAGALIRGTLEKTVTAPWNHALSVTYKQVSSDDVQRAISSAREAFERLRWTNQISDNASHWLLQMAVAVEAAQADIATLISFESGKLLPAAQMEAAATVASLRYWAEVSIGCETVEESEEYSTMVVRSPLGVVAAITPFNMPLLMMVNKIGPALLSGNSIVCKPAPNTPLTALYFAYLIAEIVPAGVVNIVANDNAGPILTESSEVDMISFTGSIEVGKTIMASAAATVKRLQLELGGNDPAIICEDADLDLVIPKIFQSAFGSAGQACVAVKRVYAHYSVVDEVSRGLAELASESQPGSPYTSGATIPTLTTRRQYEYMQELITDSRERGGEIEYMGKMSDTDGFFAQPTIISNLSVGAPLVEEEQFSPLLPVVAFSKVKDVVNSVNQSRFGLGATVWTRDETKANYIVDHLESGMVWVNGTGRPSPAVPFGGVKESGLGREGGAVGLDAFSEMKTVTFFKKD